MKWECSLWTAENYNEKKYTFIKQRGWDEWAEMWEEP